LLTATSTACKRGIEVPKAKAMSKGDETAQGVYLGERVVQREQRLTPEQLSSLDASYTDHIPQDGPDIFADVAIAYVFEKGGEEVEVLFEDFTG
jgi:hypothetical protein